MFRKLLFTLFISFLLLNVSAQKGNFHIQHYIKTQANASESIGLFVKGSQSDAKSFVEQHQGIYRGSIKGWQYIRIPGNKLETLVNDKRFVTVNFEPYKGQPMNDTMRVNNRVNAIQQGLHPLDTAYTGKGVILGFIDTGIDFMNPDFRTADDKTRVLHLWDQTLSNNSETPAQYGYGRDWDSTEIHAGNAAAHSDIYGHGSTVTGAAASNGLANGTHKGVAPNSYIISVESNFGASDWLSTVVDAVEYIYAYADSADMPCSINASVGTYLGSHDGLDPYAMYIDSLVQSKRGRLFVASAGNSGDWGKYHLHVENNNDTVFSWFNVHPNSAFGGSAAYWELWADTADFNNLEFAIGADMLTPSYSFRGRTVFQDVATNLNTTLYDTIRNTSGDQIATTQTWAELRDGQYFFQVYMPAPDSNQYYFRFETVGTGIYDCWSPDKYGISKIIDSIPDVSVYSEMSKYVLPDSLQTIVSSFQCLESTLTIGNYSNDSGYVNKYGNWVENDVARGVLHFSSSKGPSRLGFVKPELCASGDNTLSTPPLIAIANVLAGGYDTILAYGGMHISNGGTSMASPVVAGVGALMLEKCPTLSQLEFRTAIINNTYSDAHTGTNLPNSAWGYGKLDGFSAIISTNYMPNSTGNTFYCVNDSTEIFLDPLYTNYIWENGSLDSSQVFSIIDTTFVNTIDSSGCFSDTLNLIISEQALPTINQIAAALTHCEGDSIEHLITGTNIETVLWNDSDTNTIRYLYGSQTYYVNATDSLGCVSDTAFIQVIENLNPATPLIYTSYDSLVATAGYVTYYWEFDNDSLITVSLDSVISISQNGVYTVFVTDANGCVSDSGIFVYNSVGIQNPEGVNISIYPNPSRGKLTIESSNEVLQVNLIDGNGKLLKVFYQKEIDLSNYPDEVYFMEIITQEGHFIQKIVLNK